MTRWLDIAPSYERMIEMYNQLAEARKAYAEAQFALEQKENELKQRYPRQPQLREQELVSYREAVLEAKIACEQLRASVQLLEQLHIRAMLELWYATVPRAGLTNIEEHEHEESM
jgi:hypothetical protein